MMDKLLEDDVFMTDPEIGELRFSYPWVFEDVEQAESNKPFKTYARVDLWSDEFKSYFTLLIADDDFKLMRALTAISKGVYLEKPSETAFNDALPKIKKSIESERLKGV